MSRDRHVSSASLPHRKSKLSEQPAAPELRRFEPLHRQALMGLYCRRESIAEARSHPPPFTATAQSMQPDTNRRRSTSPPTRPEKKLKTATRRRTKKKQRKNLNPKRLGNGSRRRKAVIAFTPRKLDPTTAELKKLPRRGDKGPAATDL